MEIYLEELKKSVEKGEVTQDHYDKIVHSLNGGIFVFDEFEKESGTPKIFKSNGLIHMSFVLYNEFGQGGNKHVDYLRKANWIERNIYRFKHFRNYISFLRK